MKLKKCATCKKEKELINFGVDNSRRDRANFQCKECAKIAKKKYYIKAINNDKISVDFKVCTKCKINKEAKYFTIAPDTKDGLYGYCKSCRKEEKDNKRIKDMQLKFPGTKECVVCLKQIEKFKFRLYKLSKDGLSEACIPCLKSNSEALKVWRKNKKDLSRKTSDTKNLGQRNARLSRYRVKNPDRFRQYNQNRRAREKNQMGVLPKDYWQMLIDNYGELCMNVECPHKITDENYLTLDHVVPLSWGDETTKLHDMNNFQLLCQKCNSGKNNRTSVDYRPFVINLHTC